MAVKFFGQFLLEQGVIDRNAFLEASRLRFKIGQPISALALDRGILSAAQAAELDEERNVSGQAPLAVALRKKLLSCDRLEALADHERPDPPLFLGEALHRMGCLSLAQLGEQLRAFRERFAQPHTGLADFLDDDIPDRQLVGAMLSATVDLLVHYTGQVVKMNSVEKLDSPANTTATEYVFAQEILTTVRCRYALVLPEPLMLAIATHILEQGQTRIDASILDTVAEFLNTAVGRGCTELSGRGSSLKIMPPEILLRDMLTNLHTRCIVSARMETATNEFHAMFFFL